MSFLELIQVSRSFGERRGKVEVLRNVNLEVQEGEFVAIVGYSGAGKTTLISIMAGLLMPDRGRALCNGAAITGPGRERAVVFQNYSLLPWLSVFDNIRLAVDQTFPDWSARRRAEQIDHFIAMVNLTAARDKKPPQLSGGMRQRVSVARALAMDPSVLLMDEPLSALDALTRATLQDEIGRIWRENRKTVVLITNDVDEGILLADRIVPLSAGPGATLGPSIPVDLPRPRDRKAINHCERFKTLRREVFDWLRGPGSKLGRAAEAEVAEAEARATRELALPKLRPADLSGGGGGFSWRLKRSQPVVAVGVSEAEESEDLSVNQKYLECWKLAKSFAGPGGVTPVVKDFDLFLAEGEFVSLIGHSGCGKSTVLSMVAGLLEKDAGAIILANKEVRGPGPDRGVVFQSPCLLPWMTAFENVMLGVEQVFPDSSADERAQVVEYYLDLVGLGGASMHRKPEELSQGMRQRVGIARAFALSPKMLLLDEPFGMLDQLTRFELQEVLLELWRSDQKTALMVTHDVDEALFLSDRVAMMTSGPGARIGQILEVPFARPRDRNAVMEHPDYYRLREQLVGFLEDHGPSRSAAREPAAALPREAVMPPVRLEAASAM